MKNLEYVPALLPATMRTFDKAVQATGHEWRPWMKNPLVKSEMFLVSAFHGMDTKIPLKDQFENPDVKIMGDSGGFQIGQEKVKNKDSKPVPESKIRRVMKWQEENCDIGMIIDVPPGTATVGGDHGIVRSNMSTLQFREDGSIGYSKDFDIAIEETKRHVDIMWDEFENTGMKFYGVVQGNSPDQRQHWYEEVLEKDQYEGLAFGCHPINDYYQFIESMWQAEEWGYEHVHLFGFSGVNQMYGIGIALAEIKPNIKVTFDSSTWNQSASAFRWYLLPHLLGQLGMTFYEERTTPTHTVTELPCLCPACEAINSDPAPFYDEASKAWASVPMAIHNLWSYNYFVKFLRGLYHEPEDLKRICRKQIGDIHTYTGEYWNLLRKDWKKARDIAIDRSWLADPQIGHVVEEQVRYW